MAVEMGKFVQIYMLYLMTIFKGHPVDSVENRSDATTNNFIVYTSSSSSRRSTPIVATTMSTMPVTSTDSSDYTESEISSFSSEPPENYSDILEGSYESTTSIPSHYSSSTLELTSEEQTSDSEIDMNVSSTPMSSSSSIGSEPLDKLTTLVSSELVSFDETEFTTGYRTKYTSDTSRTTILSTTIIPTPSSMLPPSSAITSSPTTENSDPIMLSESTIEINTIGTPQGQVGENKTTLTVFVSNQQNNSSDSAEGGDMAHEPRLNNNTLWPVKHASVVEGDVILGGLMMVHSREDSITCGPIMPQGGIQALEAMLFTLDRINANHLLPNVTLGAHILDDCDKDTYGLEMAVDFIKGTLNMYT